VGNLAEQLYRAYCNAAGLVYGSDETPSFHNLPTEQREAWRMVAGCARSTLQSELSRDEAIELARRCAKAKPQSYYTEPFEPHEWVVDAIVEGSRGRHA
jgi:hypothetical protein